MQISCMASCKPALLQAVVSELVLWSTCSCNGGWWLVECYRALSDFDSDSMDVKIAFQSLKYRTN